MEFNAKLPVSVEVIERLLLDKYILKLGTQKIECKSVKELEVGKKYWAELKRSSVGAILISNLVKKPELLDYIDYFFNFDSLENIVEILSDTKSYRAMILDSLSNAKSKKEFLFYTNILLSLQSRIVTVPIKIDSRFYFFQFKFEFDSVNIYFVFSNLAPIQIKFNIKNLSLLQIFSPYESVLNLIQEQEDYKLDSLKLNRDIKPIFDFKNSLLDLKG